MVSEELLGQAREVAAKLENGHADDPDAAIALRALVSACEERNRRACLVADACKAGGGLDGVGIEAIREISDGAERRWDAIDQASTESTAAAGELVGDLHASLRALLAHCATLEALLADADDALRMHRRGYLAGLEAAAARIVAESEGTANTNVLAGYRLALADVRRLHREAGLVGEGA